MGARRVAIAGEIMHREKLNYTVEIGTKIL